MAMQIALQSTQPPRQSQARRQRPALATRRSGRAQYLALLIAAYPLFLVAELLQRLSQRRARDEEALRPTRSVIDQARENASIAISYALMAPTP
jgi:hypothetical protein